MLELNFHSGSSIYSSQWFACLASHTSQSNSPVTHPSYSSPLQVRLTHRSDCYRTARVVEGWVTYREVIHDSLRVRPKQGKRLGGDCRVSKK
ncbi:hypothetical protein YC2023_033751 [Brassica napus]